MANDKNAVIRRIDGELWVTFPDSVDMDNSSNVERRVESELTDEPGNIIIDLSKTTALFSSGIGLLIRFKKYADDKGKDFAVVNVSDKILEAFSDMGLNRTIKIFKTFEEYDNNRK